MSDRLAKRPKMSEGSTNEVQMDEGSASKKRRSRRRRGRGRGANTANEVERKSTPRKQICNLTTQKFSDIVGTAAFVDKTLFIKAFLQSDNDVIVTLAPRKFGKSTNMDMVKEFVTGNKKLFKDNQLKIWKNERDFFNKYCKKNPVIHVDFQNVYCTPNDVLLDSLREVIKLAFNDHKYLIKVDGENYSWSEGKLEDVGPIAEFEMYWKCPRNLARFQVISGLKDLSRCLNVYYGKLVYILIDEYDGPVMKAILETSPGDEVLDETIDLIGALMSTLFKDNEYIKKGLMMGSTRIGEVLSGDANNIQYYEFLRTPEFSPYFGFTDKEVDSLFERDEFVSLKDDKFKMWYNGYKLFHEADYVIYSSYSVLKYLWNSKQYNEPRFEKYWVNLESITYLQDFFIQTQIWILVDNLINGEEVEIDTISKFCKEDIMILRNLICQKLGPAHLFLQFLTENGYLNVVRTENGTTTIVAPNNEIKDMLKKKCYNPVLFRDKYKLCPEKLREYMQAFELLKQKRDMNAFIRFAKALSKLFDRASMPKSEDEFYSILFTVTYNFRLFVAYLPKLSVERIKRSGVLVLWNEVGMIIEFKFENKSSEEAHTQIVTEQYDRAFDNHRNVTEKILLGVHMTKKRKVCLTYTVNDSAKQTVTSNDQTTDSDDSDKTTDSDDSDKTTDSDDSD